MIKLSIKKRLKGAEGLFDLSIDVNFPENEISVLTGPSGAGKTSILRMISGLMKPDHGMIKVGNESWFDSEAKVDLKPQKRRVGYVFQEYALFPNMTIHENLKFALLKGQDEQIINDLLHIMGLAELKNEKPINLSGGQKQRVALSRSIVQLPNLLLLDEPLSALDRTMRIQLQDYLFEIQKKYALTVIMVTHDISEIFKLATHVIAIENGRVVKAGSPQDVYAEYNVSGKFQFTGEVIDIQYQDFLMIITVLIGNHAIRVIGDESEHRDLQKGDKVLVASKAFNPIIRKLS